MRSRIPIAGAALAALLGAPPPAPASVQGATEAPTAAAAIGPAAARQAISGIATIASGEGPNGSFTTEIVALAGGEARFVQRAGERRTELVVRAEAAFQRDASGALAAAAPAALEIVHGHAAHRLLLDLDRYPVAGPTDGRGCTPRQGPAGMALSVCVRPGETLPARLELGRSAAGGGETIGVDLEDWRPRLGVLLPFQVTFVQGERRFVHRFEQVLPFRLAPGAALPEDPSALADRLGDLAALAAAHEEVLAAHRASDVERLLAGGAESSLGAHRGVLSVTGPEEMRARLGPYLAATRFTRYEDVAVPALAVALDGSLGWLACQIEAAGVQRDGSGREEALAFGFAWVELYAKQAGSWRAVGNASSQRP